MGLTYEETMAQGAEEYADILEALNSAGLPSSFTQTGGMCAAIEVRLETGQTVLITDAEDTLAWDRSEHAGWGVGLYTGQEDCDLPVAYLETQTGDLESLLEVVRQLLYRAGSASATTWRDRD